MSDRMRKGYLPGVDFNSRIIGLSYVSFKKYDEALRATNLQKEEEHYQGVFHKGAGVRIAREVYQRKTRNGEIPENWMKHIVKSRDPLVKQESVRASKESGLTPVVSKESPMFQTEDNAGFYLILSDLWDDLLEDEKLVLSYLLIELRLDECLSYHSGSEYLKEIDDYVNYLYNQGVTGKCKLRSLVGTRWRTDKAWANLLTKIQNYFD